jgi:hypothetical protein
MTVQRARNTTPLHRGPGLVGTPSAWVVPVGIDQGGPVLQLQPLGLVSMVVSLHLNLLQAGCAATSFAAASARPVGSDRGVLPGFLLMGFPGPPVAHPCGSHTPPR